MRLDDVQVTLPASGVVLITGDNGHGKSSLLESVPAGLYNKTLRGSPWWRAGEKSIVELGIADSISLMRTRKGERSKLALSGFVSDEEHDTATKAQVLLDRIIPPYSVWKKTSVFSAAALEGDHFTSGGDGERKRLLEAVLAIDKFDVALKRCREDIRERLASSTEAEHKYALATAKMEAEDRRRSEAAGRAHEIKLGDKPAVAQIKELGKQLSPLRDRLEELRKLERKLGHASGSHEGDLRGAKVRYDLLRAGKCPTCEQAIAVERIEELQLRVEQLTKKINKERKKTASELAEAQLELEELQENVNELDARKRAIQKHAEAHDALIAEKANLERVLREATFASTQHLLIKTSSAVEMRKMKKEHALLKHVENVLSLSGVRAHVLAHTLVGLSQVTNKWLDRMEAGISIKLSPYSDTGATESISIAIEGAGAGHGYAACSSGQRRRIDVALLLGLAALAQAAHGVTGSTLWFDEVFDVLDVQGMSGVAAALEDLSSDRCVVVVSHSKKLRKILDAGMHLHVEDGKVSEL